MSCFVKSLLAVVFQNITEGALVSSVTNTVCFQILFAFGLSSQNVIVCISNTIWAIRSGGRAVIFLESQVCGISVWQKVLMFK